MDETKKEEFKERLESLMREDIDDLAKTAGILASWMADQEYTIAEQLAITELIRATVLVSYMTGAIRKQAHKPVVTDVFSGTLN